MTNTQIKTFVAAVLVITGVVLAVQGAAPSWGSLRRAFSAVATCVALVVLLWDRYLWSWPVVRLLANRPDVRGTWMGRIDSGWEDPVTGKRPAPIEVYVVFRQTYSTLDVRLFSSESSSHSLSASIFADSAGLHNLAVTYLNIPSALNLEKSSISHGGMLLGVRGDGAVHQLDGKYWTDRKTIGEIVLSRRADQICHGFREGVSTFGSIDV